MAPTLATQSRKKWRPIALPRDDAELAAVTVERDVNEPDSDASESSGSTGRLASESAAGKTAIRTRAVDARRARRRRKTHGKELEEAIAAGTSLPERRAFGAITLGCYLSYLNMFLRFCTQHDL